MVTCFILDGTDKEDDSLCRWSSCQRLKRFTEVFLIGLQKAHFAVVDDTLDFCEYNNNVQIEIVKLECLLEG